jgi:hypothetical protein
MSIGGIESMNDFNEIKRLLKELDQKEKSKLERKTKKEDSLDKMQWVALNVGQTAKLRIVKLPNDNVFLKYNVVFLRRFNHPSVIIPEKVTRIVCNESDDCIGKLLKNHIKQLKYKHDFKSPENKALWNLENELDPVDQHVCAVIDRTDGKLKFWGIQHTVIKTLLKMLDKNVSHKSNPRDVYDPEKGFDVELSRDGEKLYSIQQDEDSTLSKEEREMIANCKHSLNALKEPGKLENQAKLGIRIVNTNEDENVSVPDTETFNDEERPF